MAAEMEREPPPPFGSEAGTGMGLDAPREGVLGLLALVVRVSGTDERRP
jgi:hypothetical protein